MFLLKQAGMGLVNFHFVLLVSAMVSSSIVWNACAVNSSPNSFQSSMVVMGEVFDAAAPAGHLVHQPVGKISEKCWKL